jgi:hypothetical protein
MRSNELMRAANAIVRLSGLLLAAAAARGQAPPTLEFEVASVKPANPQQLGFTMRGGPGTPDPGRLTYSNVPLQRILLTAYGITTAYQISGPSSMETAKYDITGQVVKYQHVTDTALHRRAAKGE